MLEWQRDHEPRVTQALMKRASRPPVEDALQDLWLAVLCAPPPDDIQLDAERLVA